MRCHVDLDLNGDFGAFLFEEMKGEGLLYKILDLKIGKMENWKFVSSICIIIIFFLTLRLTGYCSNKSNFYRDFGGLLRVFFLLMLLRKKLQ